MERRRFVLVGGEAGIGKTRLVAEFAERQTRLGTHVTWGRCSEEGLGPYLPFVEVARQLVATADEARLIRSVDRVGELSRLLPELEGRFGPLSSPTRAEAGTEQRLLFEGMSALCGTVAPMVVVLDDLHWADEATIQLLRYLVRDLTLADVLVVATVRDADLDPTVAGLLADLDRHAETTRVHLSALTDEVLGSLVTDLVGTTVTEDLVKSVAAATDGNPFFVEELTIISSIPVLSSTLVATPRLAATLVSWACPSAFAQTLRVVSWPYPPTPSICSWSAA